MNLNSFANRILAGGLSQDEALSLVAEIYAAGIASVETVSPGAKRTRRWRLNNPPKNRHRPSPSDAIEEPQSVTNRHETSQSDGDGGASQSVTKRHKASPSDASIYISSNNREEERKIDICNPTAFRVTLAEDPEAKEIARQRGLDPYEVAAIFCDFVKDRGGKAATIFGFRNFLRKHNGPARSVAPEVGDRPSNADYMRAAALWIKDNSKWGNRMGPEPGMGGCRCPPEILISVGINPKTGGRLQ